MRSVEINALDIQIGDSIPLFGRFIEDNKVTSIENGVAYTQRGSFILEDITIVVFRD